MGGVGVYQRGRVGRYCIYYLIGKETNAEGDGKGMRVDLYLKGTIEG